VGSISSDSTPPTPPSGLSVEAISVSTADISWSASTDNQGVAHYNVYLDNILHGNTEALSYSFTGLSSATTYQVSVEAVDLSGNKSAQTSASFTTDSPIDNPPSSPTALVITGVTYNSAGATWVASTDDGSVVGYRVMLNGQHLATITGTGYNFTSLQASTAYTVSILAEDNAGQLSAPAVVQFTTSPAPDNIPPGVPQNLSASQISHNSALISWDASTDDSGILNYDIYLNDVFLANPRVTEFVVNGLIDNTSYTIKIRARDNNNNVSGFAFLTFTTLEGQDDTPPSSPANLHAYSITKTTAEIAWDASTDNLGVVGYNVFLDDSWLNFTTDLNYLLQDLTAATTYVVEVSALDNMDNESERTSHTFITSEETNSEPTFIMGSYFESGWEGWNDGGTDAYRYGGHYAIEGSYCIRLRDNSGIKSSMTTDPLELDNFNNVKIDFSFFPRSMESGEDFFLEFNNGNGWVIVSQFISGEHFQNSNIYHAEVFLSNAEYNFSNESQFRIRCDASSNADQIYIDEVNIIGNPNITETILGEQYSITYTRSMFVPELENHKNLSFSISPNPVEDLLYIDLDADIIKVEIYSMDGRLILTQDQSQNIDVSSLNNGIFIIKVLSTSGKHQKKFIKR
jgi:chitodextrinase